MQLDLDDATLSRLRERAERAGINPEELARDAVLRLLAQDTNELVGAGSSARLRGRNSDERLAEGFGRDERSLTPGSFVASANRDGSDQERVRTTHTEPRY